jgi:hypothetical protein
LRFVETAPEQSAFEGFANPRHGGRIRDGGCRYCQRLNGRPGTTLPCHGNNTAFAQGSGAEGFRCFRCFHLVAKPLASACQTRYRRQAESSTLTRVSPFIISPLTWPRLSPVSRRWASLHTLICSSLTPGDGSRGLLLPNSSNFARLQRALGRLVVLPHSQPLCVAEKALYALKPRES